MKTKAIKRNKYVKRIIGIALFAITMVVFVYFMQLFVTNDGRDEAVILKGYYLEEKDSLDMVVMGSSEIMNGYSAPEVYQKTGLTSYPYAFAVNSVGLWKYELSEIERTQNPQVLIIEINGAVYNEDKFVQSADCIKLLCDNLPLTSNRINLIREYSENPIESLFPIIKYHYRWTEAGDASVKDRVMLWKDGYSRLRAAMTPLGRDTIEFEGEFEADYQEAKLNKKAESAFRDFLEVCKESDIPNIVFVEYPHILNREKAYERHMRVNRAAAIVQEYGFDFIDLTRAINDIGLDYETDFYDTHHLMASGQRKTSVYLANLMKDKYGVKAIEQTEKNKERWADSTALIQKFYAYFDEFRKENADNPYAGADMVLRNNKETIDLLDK